MSVLDFQYTAQSVILYDDIFGSLLDDMMADDFLFLFGILSRSLGGGFAFLVGEGVKIIIISHGVFFLRHHE